MKVYAGILLCVGLLLALLAFPWDSVYRIRAGVDRAVEESREQLGAERFEDRQRAYRRLVSLGEAARPALTEALSSPDAEVRARASAALRALDRSHESPEERRRKEYAHLIRIGLSRPGGLMPGSAPYEALLLSPGLAARAGAEIAGSLEDDLLAHQRVVLLLTHLGRRESAPYLAGAFARGWWLPSTIHHLAEGLIAAADPETLPWIRTAADSTDPRTRRYAIRVLGRLGGVQDAARARAAAKDPEPDVRAEAAAALPALAGREAAEDLRALALDPEASVRASAVAALADLPDVPFRETAVRAFSDASPAVRAAGLVLLARRGETADGALARPLLHDPSPVVRGAAIRALAALGLPEWAVAAGITDDSSAVRREALLAAKGLPPEQRREALARLPASSDSFLLALREDVLTARRTN